MPVSATQFFIVCPLVFLAGFVDAVAGGGGLISLPAYLIAGLPAHFAIGTNKISSAMGTSVATLQYARRGYIPWRQAGFYVACALVGSACGARLALLLEDAFFKRLMLVILPLTALYVTRSRTLEPAGSPYPPGRTLCIGMAAALVVGAYDGFYGPGTGTFLLLLLTSAARMPLSRANGVAKVINLTTNLTTIAVFGTSGKLILPLGLAAGLFSIAGNYLGTRFFSKGQARAVRPIMLAVLALFFLRVLTEL